MRRWVPLLLCLLIATGCDDGGSSKAAQRPARVEDLAKAPVDLAKRCAKPTKDLPPLNGAKLPDHPVLVRLCPGWQTPYADGLTPSIAAPRDPLTEGADELVHLTNSLDPIAPMPAGSYCGGVGAPAVDLWFGYPDGRAVAGRWQLGGCEGMRIGTQGGRGLQRTPALFTRFAELLAEQRASETSRPAVRAPACNPTYQPVSPFGHESLPPLKVVTYCVADSRGRWRSAAVPPRLVRLLNHDATPHRRVPECESQTRAWLRGRTVFGDRVDLMGYRCRWTLPRSLAHLMRRDSQWQPSAALQHALDALPLGPPQRQLRPDGTPAGQ